MHWILFRNTDVDGRSYDSNIGQRIDQIAALPLGGRVKLDPWSNRLEMTKSKPVVLLSPQEKMPFEVTPFFPYLTRLAAPQAEAAGAE